MTIERTLAGGKNSTKLYKVEADPAHYARVASSKSKFDPIPVKVDLMAGGSGRTVYFSKEDAEALALSILAVLQELEDTL